VISLLRSEVRRLTSRRLVRVLGGLALLVVLIVQIRAFAVSDRNLDAARRRAAAASSIDAGQARMICDSMQQSGEAPSTIDCAGPDGLAYVNQRAAGSSGEVVDPRLHAAQALPQGAEAIAVGVAILGFLVGASFVGADWHAGTMQALLFWEPRRWRVILAKALALIAVLVAFAAAMQVVTAGTSWITAATRGTTEGVTGGLLMATLLTVLRGMLVITVTSLLGYGVAGLARVTAAALGAAFVYFVIVENLLRGLRPGWQRFLFSENVSAVMFKHTEVANAHGHQFSFDGSTAFFYRLSGVRGAVTLAIYLGLLLGAFYVTFTRRDVT
jgi:ABC-type transport system involved in multi-copper enzyme maturation permease subunit